MGGDAGPVPSSSLAALVASARQGEDGTQTLNLRLHPNDLGTVDVAVEVRHGVVSIELSSASSDARQALNDHLHELRSALSGAGLDLGSLDITGQGGRNGAWTPHASQPITTAPPETAAPAPRPTAPSPSTPLSGVDMHL